MNLKKFLLGDSTKYDIYDEEALLDNRYTYYSIIICYMLVLAVAAYLIITGARFFVWMSFLILGHVFISMLFLMKLNNFAFLLLNTYVKEKKGRK